MTELKSKKSLHGATLKGVALFWILTLVWLLTVYEIMVIPEGLYMALALLQFPVGIMAVFWNMLFSPQGIHADGNFAIIGLLNMVFYYYLVYWLIRIYRKAKK